jgi:hypothetical protein
MLQLGVRVPERQSGVANQLGDPPALPWLYPTGETAGQGPALTP